MQKTVLITGANSGLGFEAAAQFALEGFTRVVLGCRSLSSATNAQHALEARTSRRVFEALEIDLSRFESVRSAIVVLANRGAIDVLVLNAGVLPGGELVLTEDGIELTAAASLVGHHLLTVGLLQRGLLSPRARLVISGSEGARGDAPGMKPMDLAKFAAEHFAGELGVAMVAVLTMQRPAVHHWSTTYCTSKAMVALWAKALAPRLPKGMAVYAVSPGNVPSTNARRYWDAAHFGDDVSGQFFASPKGKLIGPLTLQEVPHLADRASVAACWDALGRVTGEQLPTLSQEGSRATGC